MIHVYDSRQSKIIKKKQSVIETFLFSHNERESLKSETTSKYDRLHFTHT